ncbi:hypothetical protein H072_7561 [Dactylellina haptotyla CBS 200.50]|uniref:CBM1 domain-containing protein n=1 Tax=Dactylellina haptotyla (strain CBS 200.50) TaxID=1284197 RepID=S8A6T7_DACHA|nr:hypothetical protein H072_7561 [Dactylellina haptotyla CBS 200.50]
MCFIDWKKSFILLFLISDLATCFGNNDKLKKPGGQCPWWIPKRKRELLEDNQYKMLSPAQKVKARLERRQDASCTCNDFTTVFYPMSTPLSYMATPYGHCDISARESNLCPTDHLCVCQTSGSSICLPTSVQDNTSCISVYTGPTVQPTTTRWLWSNIPTDLADISGQCGGTTQPTATTYWVTSQTLCPVSQVCACQTSGYSVCIDGTDAVLRGTECPNPCTSYRYEFSVSLPPPSATAKVGEQCGGNCWAGPTNCPSGATCFTETSPVYGGYAKCATSKPESDYRVRVKERDWGINVPARVRAIATRIYF